jgi:subtilisin family serine protease
MKRYCLFITVALAAIVFTGFDERAESKYYYAYDEKIYLNEVDDKLLVRYNREMSGDDKNTLSLSIPDLKNAEWQDDSTCIVTFSASRKKTLSNEFSRQKSVKVCFPFYATRSGYEMGITDEILVKFKEDITESQKEKLFRSQNVSIAKKGDNYIKVKVPPGKNALDIANLFQESGKVLFSHPNFVSRVEFYQNLPTDPYFINQFSLHNTGQILANGHSGANDADIDAPEAWAFTKGSSDIIIAVLDEGLTPNHPDLPNTRQVRLNGSNFGNGNANDPSPTGDHNHGNACAGIIGATHNNIGIAGIAPNCRIMPIRIMDVSNNNQFADAINFARNNGAHVISCSWGLGSSNPNFIPAIKDAILLATTQGRNNRGCVVVFAAGNTANHVSGNNGYISFPANVNISGVLTVGASDRFDLQANYSPTGNPNSSQNQIIDIVAPSHRAYSCQIQTETSEAWSIDIPGNAGYNPVKEGDCQTGAVLPVIGSSLPNAGTDSLAFTGHFGGTSYACPQVAAVAALLLSINPNLTQQQVYYIIVSAADKVGGYTYTSGQSNELGWGRLNAFRAVASTTTISGPSDICAASFGTFTVSNAPEGFTWGSSLNLTKISSGSTYADFSVSGYSDAAWVSINLNGMEVARHNLVVVFDAPVVAEITGPENISTYGFYTAVFSSISPATYCDWATYNSYAHVNGNGYSYIYINYDGYNYPSAFTLLLIATNACGEGLGSKGISATGYGSSYVSSYPNPVSDILQIEIDQQAIARAEALRQTTTDGKSLKIDPTYDIRLYDGQGNLLRRTATKGGKVEFNVAGLTAGIYYLHIYDGTGNKPEVRQIVVEH